MFFISLGNIIGCGRTSSSSNSTPTTQYWGANGYGLSPAGVQVGNSSFDAVDRKAIPQPSEIAVTPDGKTALVLSTGWVTYAGKSHMITAIDTSTDTIASSVSLTTPPLGYESFDGMAVNSSGTDVYVPGIQGQRGSVLDVGIGAGSTLSFKQAIPLQPYTTTTFFGGVPTQVWPTAAGIAVYGNTLITANNVAYDINGNQWPGETISIIDLSTNTQTFTLTTGGYYPWAVAITPDGKEAYVCNRQSSTGAGTVSVISSLGSTPTITATIPLNQVGSAAIISSLDGSKMYVANTLSDTVSVINTSNNTVSGTISLAMFNGEPSVGGLPNNLALSGDGKYLYVSMGADNAVAVIDTATNQVVGRIPTAVYPSGVAFDTVNNHIWVANMYGVGHGPYVPAGFNQVYNFADYAWFCYGSVSDITQPTTAQLTAYTNQVLTNDFVPTIHPRPAVPANIMSAWSNITHIVYILRENKTSDMEFGDLGTQADTVPVPCPFYSAGSLYAFSIAPLSFACNNSGNAGIGFTTPNTHALASQFALDTNFYLDIVPSIAGHPSSFQGMISDYLQRIWSINTGYGGKNRAGDSGEPVASVPSGTIFDALKNAGISFSVFGQGMPSVYNGPFDNNNPLNSLPEFDQTYGGNDFSDVTKADYFVKNIVQTNTLPNFVFMSLGDDGYEPTDTPIAAYSENDAATAMVVQAIANSKYWGSTAIFIDEDDPQPGFDHVDQERSFIIVVSPYAKHAYISTAHYGFASVLKTIELILSQSTNKPLSPMTEFDATALPMYDMFQATPDMTPFAAIPVTWNSVGWSRN
jgi:YVTN family beta-propeller protein